MEVDSDYRDGGEYVVYGSGDDNGGIWQRWWRWWYMAAVMTMVVYGSGDDDDAATAWQLWTELETLKD